MDRSESTGTKPDPLTGLRHLRRGAKAKTTRLGKAMKSLLGEERPFPEIQEVYEKYLQAYAELEQRHGNFTELIEDEDEFEKEEQWMEDCQDCFLRHQMCYRDYAAKLESVREAAVQGSVTSATNDVRREAREDASSHSVAEQRPSSSQRVGSLFRMEKPKMPTFSGNVREYCIFKADFLHTLGDAYDERDSLMILRSCLHGKPLQMIQGIGHDYQAAWVQLDRMFGDPRLVADAIINDITKFRPLKSGEEERFSDYVNLVRRSYNVIQEVGKKNDLDNSYMLSIMEKKLTFDDRKLWCRKQEEKEMSATFDNFLHFLTLEQRARIRSTAPVRSSEGKSSEVKSNVNVMVNQPSASKNKCWVCKEDSHWTDQCKSFLSMPYQKRMDLVRERKACFSCLKETTSGHRMATCKRRRRCTEKYGGQQCKFYHHPLLHAEPETTGAGIGIATTLNAEGILPVITAELIGPDRGVTEGNILFDSGSQISIIRQELVSKLKVPGRDIVVNIAKVGESPSAEGVTELRTKIYRIKVREVSGRRCHTILAVSLPYICEVQELDIPSIAKRVKLPPSRLLRGSGQIDLLIGIDHPIMQTGKTEIFNKLCLRRSPLGPVVYGLQSTRKEYTRASVLNVQILPGPDMTQFWSVESMGVKAACECEASKMTKGEKMEFDRIWNSCEKIGKQWQVPYPWKDDPDKLPNNRVQAVRMLEATEKKLAKNPEHGEAYSRQMEEMVDLGFARKLSDDEIKSYDGPVYYISHHSVLRPDKKSTPLRIVFNSSARFGGQCLNEQWIKGPDLLNNLNGVLMRFRENSVAVCGDISKMYHRVLIPIADQHMHRFLWRGLDPKREIETFAKTVVTFGDRPAAAMAQIALQRTADDAKSVHPEAALVIKRDSYMDDICTSTKTMAEAQKLTNDIDEVLAEGGFKVKGWLSNEKLQVADTSGNDQEMRVLESLAEEKVLGTVWNPETDEFSYKVKTTFNFDAPVTKRRILSHVARLFDPIGFASPFIIRAKIGMQQLWQMGVGWDEELPQKEKNNWMKLFKEMEELNNVSLPRCLTPPSAVGQPTLVIFCDASEQAFGACAYLRWELNNSDYDVRFITAKSRVAPIKKLTLPRLELQAAVLAARLCTTVKEELTLQIKDTVFMTDSAIVLGWIRSNSRSFKSFVSTRIGEIQSQSDPQQWRHIPGDVNPADDISRGIPVERLTQRWLQGPKFLRTSQEEWPQTSLSPKHPETDSEKLRVKHVASVGVEMDLIDYSRFSSWRKLLRTTAYIFRFIANLKARCRKADKHDELVLKGPISVSELELAEVFLLKEAQKPLHPRLKRQDFKTLSPFIDDGIIYVGGRASKRATSYDARHPVLLPQKHRISSLITHQAHNTGHCGVATTAAKVRAKYWIIGVHKLAKTIKHRCVVCRKMEHKTETQFMAELPEIRMAPYSPTFAYTSCDYFGPMNVRVGRNKVAKHYGVIFTS